MRVGRGGRCGGLLIKGRWSEFGGEYATVLVMMGAAVRNRAGERKGMKFEVSRRRGVMARLKGHGVTRRPCWSVTWRAVR